MDKGWMILTKVQSKSVEQPFRKEKRMNSNINLILLMISTMLPRKTYDG